MSVSSVIAWSAGKARHHALPVGSVDVLPRLAAAEWPDQPAVRAGRVTITFGELDRMISRMAGGLRGLLGGDGSVVVLSADLTAQFPVAYYGIVRSGNVVVPVSPRLGADVLWCLLVSTAARAVVLGRTMYERVRPALAGLTGVEHVLLLDGPCGTSGLLTCAELSEQGNLLVEPRDRDENELGAIRLAGGRAGHVPAAGLSHYRLKVDAAWATAEYGLTAGAVTISALPRYCQTHLNAGLLAGVTQVLCGSPHLAAAARDAASGRPGHCSELAEPTTGGDLDYVVVDQRIVTVAEQWKVIAS
jgi:long-chain acyl-CoA synthetase